jgi:hypothetical protein
MTPVYNSGKIRQTEEGFAKHMEEKARFWEADFCCILKDFAVFTFPFKYQVDRAETALNTWGSTYLYEWETDKKTQLMIHNSSPLETPCEQEKK